MSKINDIANAASEKGWTYEPGLVSEHAVWTRPASRGRTETVEVWLTEGQRPRVHHAWYSIAGGHYQRFEPSELDGLLDLIAAPGYQPEERSGECESHGTTGFCPEDGIVYTGKA